MPRPIDMHDSIIRSIIAVHDPDGIRPRERMAANTFVINGVMLARIEKTIENGKAIVAFRTEKTVAALRKVMAAARQTRP